MSTFDPIDNTQSNGEKAVEILVRDILHLADGIKGKNPEELDFETIKGYLELLGGEVERVEFGISAKDSSINYGGKWTFTKEQGTSFGKK